MTTGTRYSGFIGTTGKNGHWIVRPDIPKPRHFFAPFARSDTLEGVTEGDRVEFEIDAGRGVAVNVVLIRGDR